MLHEAVHVESVQHYGVVTRLKMLAVVNVSETSKPQDGRFRWVSNEKELEIRFSASPFVYGEGITLRLLNRSASLLPFERMGLQEEQIADLRRLMHSPCGVIIAAGPSGCGKTTLCYNMLSEIASPQIKIMTIENPVEYTLPYVNHAQANPSIGYTKPAAIRSFLRQDPDVIFVSELSDLETAELAVQPGITGHLVITTLFAEYALGVIDRLIEIGIERFMVGATLTVAIAQRLVRKVCEECKKKAEVDPNDPAISFLGITTDDLKKHNVYRGKGCEKCRNTGYLGRIGVFEVLVIENEMSRMIGRGASADELLNVARANGFVTMCEDAKRKVLAGIITPEEAMRVLI